MKFIFREFRFCDCRMWFCREFRSCCEFSAIKTICCENEFRCCEARSDSISRRFFCESFFISRESFFTFCESFSASCENSISSRESSTSSSFKIFCKTRVSFFCVFCESWSSFCEFSTKDRISFNEKCTSLWKVRWASWNRFNFFCNRRNFICSRVNSFCDREDRSVNRERLTSERNVSRTRFEERLFSFDRMLTAFAIIFASDREDDREDNYISNIHFHQ